MFPVWVNIKLVHEVQPNTALLCSWKGNSRYEDYELKWTAFEYFVYAGLVSVKKNQTIIIKISTEGFIIEKKFFPIIVENSCVLKNILYCTDDAHDLTIIHDFNL